MRSGLPVRSDYYEKEIAMQLKRNKTLALTGGAAAAEALRQIHPDVMAVYPITPQTPIIETYAKFHADGLVDTEIIQVESEHSAMSACIGASAAGARTVTATSSQGLALMHEMLYIASGMRLPILLLDSARALAAPLNIHGDHSDVMGSRDAGWAMLFSENVQEVYDTTIIAMKLAEMTRVPMMAIMDGFQTSHTIENVSTLPDETVRQFIGDYNPKQYLLDVDNPVTFGPLALPNTYFEFKLDQAQATEQVATAYKKVAYEFEKISGRFYDFYESYFAEDADYVIVAMGSVAGTTKVVVDKLRAEGKKVGLVKIKLFRPFPHQELDLILARVKSVAVLDRAMSVGTFPPLYGEIVNSINLTEGNNPAVASYVYGLGGRDTFAADIERVFADLEEGKKGSAVRYLGAHV